MMNLVAGDHPGQGAHAYPVPAHQPGPGKRLFIQAIEEGQSGLADRPIFF